MVILHRKESSMVNVEDAILTSEPVSRSPVPTKKLVTLSFPDAMKEVIAGKRISKLEWNTNDIYCKFVSDFLCIYKNGQFSPWHVNSGDLFGTDWFVLPE